MASTVDINNEDASHSAVLLDVDSDYLPVWYNIIYQPGAS